MLYQQLQPLWSFAVIMCSGILTTDSLCFPFLSGTVPFAETLPFKTSSLNCHVFHCYAIRQVTRVWGWCTLRGEAALERVKSCFLSKEWKFSPKLSSTLRHQASRKNIFKLCINLVPSLTHTHHVTCVTLVWLVCTVLHNPYFAIMSFYSQRQPIYTLANPRKPYNGM